MFKLYLKINNQKTKNILFLFQYNLRGGEQSKLYLIYEF